MYRVARQSPHQQQLQRSASGSSAGLPPSYPVSAAASRSDTEDGSSVFMPVGILRSAKTTPELPPLPLLAAVAYKQHGASPSPTVSLMHRSTVIKMIKARLSSDLMRHVSGYEWTQENPCCSSSPRDCTSQLHLARVSMFVWQSSTIERGEGLA